jgi:hypothetical protein
VKTSDFISYLTSTKRKEQKTTLPKVVYVANIIIHTNLQDPALNGSDVAVTLEDQHRFYVLLNY